MEIKLNLPK